MRRFLLLAFLAVGILPAYAQDVDPFTAAPPTVPGHHVILKSGKVLAGLVLNPDETEGAVRLKTPTGMQEIPRKTVSRIAPKDVDATAVHNPDELYEIYLEEGEPETGPDHVELADRCVRVGAFVKAKLHYERALEDPAVAEGELAGPVRTRLAKAEIFIRYEAAKERVARVRRLRSQRRYDQALEELADLVAELGPESAIAEKLELAKLEKGVREARRDHLAAEVQRLFTKQLDKAVRAKIREKDLTAGEAVSWAQNPKGLGAEIFAAIAKATGLSAEEAAELWGARTSRQLRRYNYRGGTFIHPEITAKISKREKEARRGNKRKRRPKPKTASDWWASARDRAREGFLKAWFAEFSTLFHVVRFEERRCANCGGKGVACSVCNFAALERVVVCR